MTCMQTFFHRLLFLALGALVLAGCQSYPFHGTVLNPPPVAADWALTNQDGQTTRLSDYRGRLVLLFFGYTHCPDVCPTTLAQFKTIRAKLGGQADRVRFLFITVDPERDTPAVLKEFLALFDPNFIGLTGTTADLEPVWKSYGVYHEKRTEGSTYLVDHTARIYVIDGRGSLRLTWLSDASQTADEMVQDIQHLLASTSQDESANGSRLQISGAWARPAHAGGTSGAYLTIVNAGAQADALVGAQSPLAESAEVHETRMAGAVMQMQPVVRVEVSAGGQLELKPGGYHIMLMGLKRALAVGDRVPIILQFERGGAVQIEATVNAP
jgi:protein SCO1/2